MKISIFIEIRGTNSDSFGLGSQAQSAERTESDRRMSNEKGETTLKEEPRYGPRLLM